MKVTKKGTIYAWVIVLALIASAYTYFASPSLAEETAGSDGPVYLYDGSYTLQEGSSKTWDFAGEVYASEVNNNASDAFTCPAQSTSAYTFISNRGQERTGLNGWNAAANQIFPAGSKNLLEVNFTPSANIIALKLPQASIKSAGGQYSLGVACTTNNGVTVVAAWYRYIEVTPTTGDWKALPNGNGSGGGGGGEGGGGEGGGGEGGGGTVDPTLGFGTDGLTLTPATTGAWLKDSVYYNLNVRNFSQTHDLDGVTARMSSIKALGVGVLVLEPIFPVSQTGMPGTIGDIYAPSTTASINPELGTDTDLNELIEAAHSNNIKVVLTWVTDRIGNDSTWINDHSDWIRYQGLNRVHPEGAPYATSIDFGVPELRAEIITQMKSWVTTFDLDGFASPVAGSQPLDFWNEATYRVNQLRPVAFITASPLAGTYNVNSFGAVKRTEFITAVNTLSKGNTLNTTWKTALTGLSTANRAAANINGVTDTTTGELGKSDATRLGTFLNSALALSYVVPGTPLLNAGQEIAYSKSLKPYDVDNIVWPTKAHSSTALLTKLAKLRTTNTVLSTGTATTLTTSVKTAFAFKRSGSAGTVYFIGNLTKKALTVKVTFGAKGTVYDFTSGKKLSIAASQNVSVPAAGFLIYSSKQVK